MSNLVKTLGEHPTPAELAQVFATADKDGSGEIDFNEFSEYLVGIVQKEHEARQAELKENKVLRRANTTGGGSARALQVVSAEDGQEGGGSSAGDDGEDDDEPEIPEDILDLHLSPEKQRSKLLQRSLYLMGVGTFIVLLFSDPMVDVLDALGTRTGIPAFFVAFCLGPVASNASEMVASYKFAKKKSMESISVSFSQLLGAACMNNTFCLLIFYLLIAVRGLAWTYHAEVIGIVAAEVIMAVIASKRVHTFLDGCIALSVLPLCLAIVAVLKYTVFKKYES